jgi:hypothetical protein
MEVTTMNSAYNKDKLTLTVFPRANIPHGEIKELTFEDMPEFFFPKSGEKDGPAEWAIITQRQ